MARLNQRDLDPGRQSTRVVPCPVSAASAGAFTRSSQPRLMVRVDGPTHPRKQEPSMHLQPRRFVLSAVLSLGAIASALAIPAATFAATTPTTAATGTCDEGRWPASVQGEPTIFHAGARAGDYIWHSGTGWHIRVTHPGSLRVVFRGTIVSNTALTVVPVRLESGDTFALSADHKTLTYRLVNHGHVDGLDFRTACATHLKFGGSMAGVKLPVGRIWLGRAGHHPLQNPFVILRNR
jgi:hypothetical protein